MQRTNMQRTEPRIITSKMLHIFHGFLNVSYSGAIVEKDGQTISREKHYCISVSPSDITAVLM
jgi:hypothetical protein